MLYKRSIGVGQTFLMSFQYDCLKFLLNKKKIIDKMGKKVHLNGRRSSDISRFRVM